MLEFIHQNSFLFDSQDGRIVVSAASLRRNIDRKINERIFCDKCKGCVKEITRTVMYHVLTRTKNCDPYLLVLLQR